MPQQMILPAALLTAGIFFGMGSMAALAQGSFPSKPIRIVVGFEPGGPNDTQARLIGGKIGEAMGQTVLVDNRPGADGIIGGEIVAKSAADGHTMLLVSAGHTINNNFVKKMPYHAANDFTAISYLSSAPFFLVVHPSVPANTTAELIKYAKDNPNKLHYGSSGLGSSLMMAMELFKNMAGITAEHVPYKGGAPATADLIAGRVQVMTNNAVSSLPNARAGKLRVLAATTAQRSPLAPDIPTIAETVPGYAMDAWYGLMGPKGIPAPALSRLNSEINKALASDDVKQRYAKLGLTPVGGTPEFFMKHVQTELAKWARVVKDSGISVE
jgi:tripartite-type tricarboxylate transporter receptor subunit TctC